MNAPVEEGVSPSAARQLQIIAFAMGAGLILMAGLVVWSHLNAGAKLADAGQARLINTLTTAMMVLAFGAIVASEIAWRALLRRSAGSLNGRVSTAYIVRLACREGAGLLGLTVAYIAAVSGVLRVYPAYWVNLAPFGLFLVFLATHWPTAERLESEAREVLGENPSFLKK